MKGLLPKKTDGTKYIHRSVSCSHKYSNREGAGQCPNKIIDVLKEDSGAYTRASLLSLSILEFLEGKLSKSPSGSRAMNVSSRRIGHLCSAVQGTLRLSSQMLQQVKVIESNPRVYFNSQDLCGHLDLPDTCFTSDPRTRLQEQSVASRWEVCPKGDVGRQPMAEPITQRVRSKA